MDIPTLDGPVTSLGDGPRRDPPLWARTTRFLANRMVEDARRFYEGAEAGEIWPASAVVVCRNGETVRVLLGSDLAGSLRSALTAGRAVRYALAIESWMSLPDKDFASHEEAEAWFRQAQAPERDPRRREVFAVQACERSGRDEARTLELVRGPDGGVAGLREIPELSTGKVRSLRAIGPLGRMF